METLTWVVTLELLLAATGSQKLACPRAADRPGVSEGLGWCGWKETLVRDILGGYATGEKLPGLP